MALEDAKSTKVVLNGETIIDVTPTTATEEAVFDGRTFLGADGRVVTGTLQVPLSYMANGGIAYIEKGCSTMHKNNLTNVIQKNGTDFPCIAEDSLDSFDSFRYEDFNRKPVQGEYFLVHTLDKDLHIVSFLGQVTSLNDAAQTFEYAIVFMANDAEAEALQVVYSDANTSGATTSETKRPGNNGIVDLSDKTTSDLLQAFLSSTDLTFNARVFNRAPKEDEYFSFVAKTKDEQLLSIFAQIIEVPLSAGTTYKYKILALPDTPIGFTGEGEHAEIFNNYETNKATGDYSHAEGTGSAASGEASHTEGKETKAIGNYSHAEGQKTQATGLNAHAEGGETKADGQSSHAEGVATVANGHGSHAEGYFTEANGLAQHVEGRYNITDNVLTNQHSISNYIHIAGNGTSPSARSNAYTLDWNGNAWFAGDVYVDSTGGINKDDGSKKLATLAEAKDYADSLAGNYDAAGSAEDALEAAKAYTDSVKAGILGEGITETFDTLKEIENWIDAQGGSAVELTKSIAAEAKTREDADKELNQRLTTAEGLVATHTQLIGDLNSTAQNMSAVITEHTQSISALSQGLDGLGKALEDNYYSKPEIDSLFQSAAEGPVIRDENGDILVPDTPSSANAAISYAYAQEIGIANAIATRPYIREYTVADNAARDEKLSTLLQGYGDATGDGPYRGDHVKITVTETNLTHLYYYNQTNNRQELPGWIEIAQYYAELPSALKGLQSQDSTLYNMIVKLACPMITNNLNIDKVLGLVNEYASLGGSGLGGVEIMPYGTTTKYDFIVQNGTANPIYYKGPVQIIKQGTNGYTIIGDECNSDGTISSIAHLRVRTYFKASVATSLAGAVTNASVYRPIICIK